MKNKLHVFLAMLAIGAMPLAMFSCSDNDEDNSIPTIEITNLTDGKIVVSENKEFLVELKKTPENQFVEFISSDTKIFTVNHSGRITGVTRGNAVITVRNVENHKIKVEYPVEVLKAEEMKVTAIKVSETEVTVNLGATLDVNEHITILPENAYNKKLEYAVTAVSGDATIDEDGILTPVKMGEVSVNLKATDGSNVKATLKVTIKDFPVIPVAKIQVPDGNSMALPVEVTMPNTLNLKEYFIVLPDNATVKTLKYSITPMGGSAATINDDILTPTVAGMMVVTAKSTDGSDVSGNLIIRIQAAATTVLITEIKAPDGNSMASPLQVSMGSTLDLKEVLTILPSNATNKKLDYQVSGIGGNATVDSNGILTPVTKGLIMIMATALDGSFESCELYIEIKEAEAPVLITEIKAPDGNSMASPLQVSMGSTLDLKEVLTILPSNATNKKLDYQVGSMGGNATVDSNGILTPVTKGLIMIMATALDGSFENCELYIEIKEAEAPVLITEIKAPDGNSIGSPLQVNMGSTLDLKEVLTILPLNATNKKLDYQVGSVGGNATVDSNGILTPTTPGLIMIMATALDGSFENCELFINILP